MIRVAIADDDPSARAYLRQLLQQPEDIEIAGEADNGERVMELIRSLRPDIVIVDRLMPRLGGSGVLLRLQNLAHRPSVLIISITEDPQYIQGVKELGARGYLYKKALADQLLPALRAIHNGKSYFPI